MQLRTEFGPLLVDLLGRRAEIAKDGFGHRQGDFGLLGDDMVGSALEQHFTVPDIRRSDQNLNRWVQKSGHANHIGGLRDVRGAQDQTLGFVDPSTLEGLDVARIP